MIWVWIGLIWIAASLVFSLLLGRWLAGVDQYPKADAA